MKYYGAGEVARLFGVPPQAISNLLYRDRFHGDLCPLVAGRRVVPEEHLDKIESALRRAGFRTERKVIDAR